MFLYVISVIQYMAKKGYMYIHNKVILIFGK